MKLKYYLRGLGTGIVFTAIVLAIIYSYRTSDGKIIAKAKELGMVMEGSTVEETIPENTTPESTTPENTTPESTTPDNTTPESTTPESTTQEETTTEPATEPITNNGASVTLTIQRGMYSEAVAVKLQELGVISDVGEFNKYLISNGYADRIRVGTFVIDSNSTYEQIANIITGH